MKTANSTQITFQASLWQGFEDLFRVVKQALAENYSRQERIVHGVMLLIIFGSVIVRVANALGAKFTVFHIPVGVMTGLPMLLAIWWTIAQVNRKKWPRLTLCVITFCNIWMFMTVFTLGCVGMLTTPFPIFDHHLVLWDHHLGFDVTVFMAWVHQFPTLIHILNFCYDTWEFQIFILAPFLLALLKKTDELNRYFLAMCISILCCGLIYYFLPTIAPAGVMHSPYFTQDQFNLIERFNQIHQRLPITIFSNAGVVAFPSCHVMGSLLVLTAFRKIKMVFYPLLVIDFFLILATMGLGYHYLVDVLAAFVIVAITLFLVRVTSR